MRGVLIALALVLCASPAVAGPTRDQPATKTISQARAHHVAHYALDTIAVGLPQPHRERVGRCTGGPKVWRCPVDWRSPDSRCSASVWVWAHRDLTYYEWHRMRCA